MNARKVLEMGGGTLLVSLPKTWAKRNGISKGSTVSVDELSGRRLIVRPIEDVSEKPHEAEVEYPRDELTQVANDITGAYLLGYDVIRVHGKRPIAREDREKLKATIARLIGLEVMDEDSKRITVQFILEPSAIDPERMVRRMSGILEGMIKDAAEGIAKSDSRLLSLVSERDDEVDRLYFLLVRMIRTATIHQEVAERYRLAPVEVLDYRVLASFLESVGDAMAELARKMRLVELPKGLARKYSACALRLKEIEDLSLRSFLTRGSGRSSELYAKLGELSQAVSADIVELARTAGQDGSALIESLGAVDRVNKLLVDISDLSIPSRGLQSPWGGQEKKPRPPNP